MYKRTCYKLPKAGPFVLLLFGLSLSGCQTTRPTYEPSVDYKTRLNTLHKELKSKERAVDELREKNWILMQRQSLVAETKEARSTQLREVKGEHYLYSKVIETYRKKNPEMLKKSTDLLLKAYPNSVYADNALYLCGLYALENSSYSQAIQLLDRVLKQYPTGNKAASALFAKAVAYKKMKKFEKSRLLLGRLVTLYPGSPEAKRASTELQLLVRQAKAGL